MAGREIHLRPEEVCSLSLLLPHAMKSAKKITGKIRIFFFIRYLLYPRPESYPVTPAREGKSPRIVYLHVGHILDLGRREEIF